MNTKKFPLRDILTVVTGRLLTKPDEHGNGIGALYELLNWMTDDELFTHQLPRASDECKPWLLRWFPELRYAADYMEELTDSLNAAQDKELAVNDWIDRCVCDWGMHAEYMVPRIPADDHEKKDAVQELIDKVGGDNVVVIKAP